MNIEHALNLTEFGTFSQEKNWARKYYPPLLIRMLFEPEKTNSSFEEEWI